MRRLSEEERGSLRIPHPGWKNRASNMLSGTFSEHCSLAGRGCQMLDSKHRKKQKGTVQNATASLAFWIPPPTHTLRRLPSTPFHPDLFLQFLPDMLPHLHPLSGTPTFVIFVTGAPGLEGIATKYQSFNLCTSQAGGPGE